MSMNNRQATRMRVRAIIRKESLQILRDPSSIAIAFIMPLVLLLLPNRPAHRLLPQLMRWRRLLVPIQ